MIMVTHNMLQALRISDKTAFFLLGEVVEASDTDTIFSTPTDPHTADYRFSDAGKLLNGATHRKKAGALGRGRAPARQRGENR